MKLICFSCPEGNFGDDLNAWIWDLLIPGWRDWDDEVLLIGVGTLISSQLISGRPNRRALVLGTGVGYSHAPLTHVPKGWDIRALRGPESARQLGLPEHVGIIDPAAMVPDLLHIERPVKESRPIFVPHHQSVDICEWESVCRKFGVDYISPCGDSIAVIKAISRSSMVIAESMHAAIFAESFRIPWIPVRVGWQFNADKWIDVFEASKVDLQIESISPAVDRLATILRMPRGKRLQKRFWNRIQSYTIEKGMERIMSVQPILGDSVELEKRKDAYRRVLSEAQQHYS